jgi:hypothetical protein
MLKHPPFSGNDGEHFVGIGRFYRGRAAAPVIKLTHEAARE